MRALFLTTTTNEIPNHIRAWERAFGKAEVQTFNYRGIRQDHLLLQRAKELKPEVMFYIGACAGEGNPTFRTFRDLRKIAPLVNLCSDAEDHPWHSVLNRYRREECFDLQVALDGARNAPVDLSILTPIDPILFRPRPSTRSSIAEPKDIFCGFSGTLGKPRKSIFRELEKRRLLTFRPRETVDGYDRHAQFIRRCQIVLNTSWTGTGERHHVKGRVLEAGWGRCALLEMRDSPTKYWFPEGSFLTYETAAEVRDILRALTKEDILRYANNLAAHVEANYTPRQLYGRILERLNVGIAFAGPSGQPEAADPGLGGNEGDQPSLAPAG